MFEQVMVSLAKLAQRQKNQRAMQFRKWLLKQSFDRKMDKNFEPITKNSKKWMKLLKK